MSRRRVIGRFTVAAAALILGLAGFVAGAEARPHRLRGPLVRHGHFNTPAASAASAPKLLQGSYVANYFLARPPLMSFYSPIVKTFTSYIAGPGITRSQWRHGHMGSIRWTSWSTRGASGVAEEWDDACAPNCYRGMFLPTPVTLWAWRVRLGRFTRLSVTAHAPGLRPLTFAYWLLLTHKRYGGIRIYYWGTSTTVAGT